jgi:hypothetical protein
VLLKCPVIRLTSAFFRPCGPPYGSSERSYWSSSRSNLLGTQVEPELTAPARPLPCLAHRTLSTEKMGPSPPPNPISPPNEAEMLVSAPTCERRCADAAWIVCLHELPSAYLLRSGCRGMLDKSNARRLRRRGAKASSTVSGMSQGRREPLLREFLPILARMSRRNFRGWSKSLTTLEALVRGVPAIWTEAPFGS